MWDVKKTYPAKENKKGEILVGGKSSSWLCGQTLNALIARGVTVKKIGNNYRE